MRTNRSMAIMDGNEAAARIAFKTNEVIAIYPITPSTAMGELSDAWAAAGERNLWGAVPAVQEMQSEGGAAGAIHGALQTGALCTTFTASQGLLLMIPNMYKIAGELTPAVFHIAARSIATQGLSIFGDHSDVMATRGTGWAMLFAANVQEAHDFALIAQAATLRSRVPFLHVFDGFRTSHELAKIYSLSDSDIRAMIDDDLVRAHRSRALSPDHPVIRGTAQNPDVYFQARETVNPYHDATPSIVQATMDDFASTTGRRYRLFEYAGAPDATRVIVIMGSGAETAQETAEYLSALGDKVGVLKVRLFRPFSVEAFLEALPSTTTAIAVLDRTKEPGSAGEPLYQDIATALQEANVEWNPRVIGGRYGLASKEFTPAMVKAVFDELAVDHPKRHFTVGINDDVSHTSLEFDPTFSIEQPDTVRALFWGLGSDGTVGANKNTIKIIGEETRNYAQGYFVYDSKKSGSVTISHLRFGPRPIRSPYLIDKANFIAVHQFGLLERYPVLDSAEEGATVLINSPYGPFDIWDNLPMSARDIIENRRLRVFVVDGYAIAKTAGMGGRINTIMQTAFFALSGVLPREEAISRIKHAIKKTYGRRGEAVVQKNYAAVDAALERLYEVGFTDPSHLPLRRLNQALPEALGLPNDAANRRPSDAKLPEFVSMVTNELIAGRGDLLPVSALPVDGTYPIGTAKWEKRNIALESPIWEPDLCIQCGKCVLVCPHSVIRAKAVSSSELASAPEGFKTMPAKWRELPDHQYTIQVSAEDCTGCRLCVEVCPARDKCDESRKALNMAPQPPQREDSRRWWPYFLDLPEPHRSNGIRFNNIKNIQLLQPLFEFSGACSGCGETPYLKLLSQLFGDRAIIANATGCSSIYGGNLPTTPWSANKEGRGPAWSNSLFEDNAEFGLGMRLTVDQQSAYAKSLVEKLRDRIGAELAESMLAADQSDESGISGQRERIQRLKETLDGATDSEARDLIAVADSLVERSVWIVGGDGWAYDIGYGGLDHVLASGRNVNILVLDTEVYSNTGGQASKSTGRGAVAKFATGGKRSAKKDLGRMAMAYENVYVAQVAMGANDSQTVKAFIEAETYPGVSLIIAYAHCIAHGIDMTKGLEEQKLAVDSGSVILYRYDPRLNDEGKNTLILDSREPSIPLSEFESHEDRYKILMQSDPETATRLLDEAQTEIRRRWREYSQMAGAK